MRSAVIVFPGSNCDRDLAVAIEAVTGARPAMLWHRETELPAGTDFIAIPGGFSYGDYLRSGAMAARSPVMRAVADAAARGVPVLGVCNGFQVLVDTGLLEGLNASGERTLALSNNLRGRFECRWVHLLNEDSRCSWLPAGRVWPVPIAHGEGRLAVRDPAVLQKLTAERRIVLRYVRADGSRSDDFETCPNGSLDQIAGLCDMTGRVIGLMPHPERNITPWHHPQWTRLAGTRSEGEGLDFYRRMVVAASQSATTRSARVPTNS